MTNGLARELRRVPAATRTPPRVGDGIRARPHNWSFGGDVWRHFDEHIRRSIPGYLDLHDWVVERARHHVMAGSLLYELGSATGTLSQRLAEALPECAVIGIDVELPMVQHAKPSAANNLHYECQDLCVSEFRRCSWVTSCYTLQFLPVAARLPLLRRVHCALETGGAFVLAEKVKRRDPALESSCRAAHHDFKRRQGFTDEEIHAKASSIDGVLIPLFDEENVSLLHQAGFETVSLVFRNACFDAWLAIK